VGVKVEGEVADARPGTYGGVGGPGAEMVEGELREGEEVIPQVRRKVRVSGGESGDKVVLRGADAPFSGEGAVNTGGNELDGEGNAAEVGAEGLGRFIVHDELGKGVSMGGEEVHDGSEGGEVGGGGFGSLGGEVDVPTEVGDQNILVALSGKVGETTGEVGSGTWRAGDGQGERGGGWISGGEGIPEVLGEFMAGGGRGGGTGDRQGVGRGGCTAGPKPLTDNVQVAESSVQGKGGVAADNFGSQSTCLDPSLSDGIKERGYRGGAHRFVPIGYKGGIPDIADGGGGGEGVESGAVAVGLSPTVVGNGCGGRGGGVGGGEDVEGPEVLVGELGAREEGEGVARVKKFHVRRRENGVSAGTEEGGEGDKGVSKSGGGSTPKREWLEAGGEEDPAGAGGFSLTTTVNKSIVQYTEYTVQ
jgi:hypothetical protein